MSTEPKADDGSGTDSTTTNQLRGVEITARGPAKRIEETEDGTITMVAPTETTQRPKDPERLQELLARPVYTQRLDSEERQIAFMARKLFDDAENIEPVDGEDWEIEVSIPARAYHEIANEIAGGGSGGPPNTSGAYDVLADNPVTGLGPALAWIDARKGGSPYCTGRGVGSINGPIPSGIEDSLEAGDLVEYVRGMKEPSQ